MQLLDGEVIQPQHTLTHPQCPVVYRQHIYFCSGEDARESFMQCPSKYLKQQSPKPVVPIRMAIIGPPKSGKTTCECPLGAPLVQNKQTNKQTNKNTVNNYF